MQYNSLTLMSAGICNLDCSFCFLQNKKLQSTKDQHDLIIQAWKDGSYLQNVKNVFLKNNYNFETINNISLWGGETLLNIQDITNQLEILYSLFPNIQSWQISTNFMINIDYLIKFLEKINLLQKKSTIFNLQLSIDGPPGIFIEKGHRGNWDIYRNNLTKIINYFNNNQLSNIKIFISLNSVLSKDVFLNELDSKEKINNYVQYMHNYLQHNFNNIINTKNIQIMQQYSFPKLDTTADLTEEERNKLLYIYNLFESIKFDKYKNDSKTLHFYQGIAPNLVSNSKIVDKNIECGGAIKYSLTLLPDGTAIRCSSCYMSNNDTHRIELKNESLITDLMAYNHENKFNFNLLLNDINQTNEYYWRATYGTKNTFNTYLHFLYMSCKELLDCYQISEIYKDQELLLKHIETIMPYLTCDKENVRITGIPFLPPLYLLRRYFNGIVNMAFNQKITDIKYNEE